jgi:hypothetical protein
MTLIILTIAQAALIACVADLHAEVYAKQKPISWWWHPVWVLPFAILPIIEAFKGNWLLAGSLALLRVLAFSPALNLIRHKDFFYIHGESENGSWWDRQLEKIPTIWYEVSWSLFMVGYITLFIELLNRPSS